MRTNYNLFTTKIKTWDTSNVHGWLHIYASPEFLEIRLRNLWVIESTPTEVFNLSYAIGKQLPWMKYKEVVQYYNEDEI